MTDISVIIPVYNAQKTLSQCLDSILTQTLKDIEIICIDDGSEDDSFAILQQYAAADSRIKILQQQHGGSGGARNMGIEHASGKYLAFADSDDLYPESTTLEKLFTKAEVNQCDICGGSLMLLDHDRIVASPNEDYIFAEEGFCNYIDYQYDYGYLRFIYKTELIKQNQLYFPDYLRGQDPPFFVKTMLTAGKFYRIPDICYLYRTHDTPFQPKNFLQVIGKLRSFRDILRMSAENQLAKLHYIQVERLNWYIYFACPYFNHPEIRQTLSEIHQIIDPDLLAQINQNFKPHDYLTFLNSSCKISVILPVYNVAPYLAKCLDSIIGQTCKDIEIICINDGSTDDSLKILEKYQQADSRITIIDQPNGGLSCARNSGLKQAHAPYIAFIDSDDWIAPDYLEKLLGGLLRHNADSAVCSCQDVAETPEQFCRIRSHQSYVDRHSHNGLLTNAEIEISSLCANAWMKLYKKSLIDKYKLQFPEGLINEDEAWHWYYMLVSQNTFCMPDKLYYHLINKESIMGTRNASPKITDILQVYLLIYRFLKKRSLWKWRKKEFYQRSFNLICGIFAQAPDHLKHHVAIAAIKFLHQTKARKIPKEIYRFIKKNSSIWEQRSLRLRQARHKIDTKLRSVSSFVAAYFLFPWYIAKINKKIK